MVTFAFAHVFTADALTMVERHAPSDQQHAGDAECTDHPRHVAHGRDDALGPGGLDPGARVDHREQGGLGGEKGCRSHRYSCVGWMVGWVIGWMDEQRR